jgi:primosomal protein N' (replication factor Y)
VGSGPGAPIALNARIVPDVPSFAVDDGFVYSVPDGIEVTVGSIVRVPLGGRRVRGWVIGTAAPPKPGLRDVLGVSGNLPVFDAALLGVLRWAAAHYVAPLSAVLAKASPPNAPRRAPHDVYPRMGSLPESIGLPGPGSRARPVVFVGPVPPDTLIGLVGRHADAERTAVVVAPTATEAEETAARLEATLGTRVVQGGSRMPGAEVTRAWVAAATRPGTILVGTREVAAWPYADPGVVVVLGEGRRGMKDKATPTVHARDLLIRRAGVERFALVLADLVPTAEALGRAGSVMGRAGWGLVEVIDRRQDPPGTGLFAAPTAAALRSLAGGGQRVFVFTDRRTTAMRCVRCRELRRCPACGAAPGGGIGCVRCGATVGACASCGGGRFEALGAGLSRVIAEVARIVGTPVVGEAGSGKRVEVGTERDLPGLRTDLAIIVDADGPLMAPNYRASEDGFRLLARVVMAAGIGRGRRAIVQTAVPGHPAIRALLSRDPVGFVHAEAAARAALGFPPGGELLAVEASRLPAGAEEDLTRAIGSRAEVLGPARVGDRLRWLVQGRDLTSARVVVRGVVGRWRESGARVRVDADPIDL